MMMSLAVAGTPNALAAESAGKSYEGTTIHYLIGSSPGGGTDTYGRLLAKYLPAHLPGAPQVVPQNIRGGSGLKMLQYFAEIDVSADPTIAMISSSYPFRARSGKAPEYLDPRKLKWIGSFADSTNVCVFSTDVEGISALSEQELTVGATSRQSNSYAMYAMLNEAFGYRLRPVLGYKGTSELGLAVARGELDGMCTSRTSYVRQAGVLNETNSKVVLYMGPQRRDDVGAPFMLDLEISDDKRDFLASALASISFARPLALHPDASDEELETMRAAMKAVTEDPEFLAEAEKIGLEIRYTSGEEITAAVDGLYETPNPVIEDISRLLYADEASE